MSKRPAKKPAGKPAIKPAPRHHPSKKRLISIAAVVLIAGFVAYKVLFSFSSATYVTAAFQQGNRLVELCPNAEETLENTSLHEFPLINPLQQKRLAALPALSGNLVANPRFDTDYRDNPIDFNHNDDSDRSSYEVGAGYLRAINATAVPDGAAGAGWVMSAVSLDGRQTYRYAVRYRSSIEVIITVDAIAGDKHTYRDVARLPASTSWATYYGIFDASLSGTGEARIIASSRQKGTLDIAEYRIEQIASARLPSGMVSLTFDDGWKSIYKKAAPILSEYGYKTTQYIISDVAEHDSQIYMNPSQITTLQQQGHEIGSHSLQHCDTTQLSIATMTSFADKSYASLSARWGNITSFAYPFGSYSSQSQKIFGARYQYIRTTDGGYNDRYFDREYIMAYTVHKNMSLADFTKLVNTARQQHSWLVLVYHGVDGDSNYDITSRQLRSQLAIIKQSGLTVSRLSDAADTIKSLP